MSGSRFAAAATLGILLCLSASALALTPGVPAPEIALHDQYGSDVRLAELRGRVVVVHFWATWCAHCGVEMALLQRMHAELGDAGLRVVGVSEDESASNLSSFLDRAHVSFPIVHDAGHAVARRYQAAAMPETYLVDRQGIVRYVHRGFRASDAARIEREVRSLVTPRRP